LGVIGSSGDRAVITVRYLTEERDYAKK